MRSQHRKSPGALGTTGRVSCNQSMVAFHSDGRNMEDDALTALRLAIEHPRWFDGQHPEHLEMFLALSCRIVEAADHD